MSRKAILFLYEGETEGEFFPILFKSKITPRGNKFKQRCLKGNFNINSKVANAISDFLQKNEEDVYVFISLDRDGHRSVLPPIDIELIKTKFSKRLKEINLIIATQDFESWLFIEIKNIYEYLKVPHSKRNVKKYKNHESFNSIDMYNLFKHFGKHYQKGKKIEGLLKEINVDNIHDTCIDLKEGIKKINDCLT